MIDVFLVWRLRISLKRKCARLATTRSRALCGWWSIIVAQWTLRLRYISLSRD